ncbi:hypothetical protein AURANDRAFT_69068 [Aureococcus anophagefferens]|uniref:Uncharacterized protein n=1 Tax=Aureococcus anophagefferens TaxID=44056 RepID=F0YRM2_AURAN|nr:hypothetical protein AURANDRAFT_69068 [Aureococcus anophagefferens]EGB02237.1 hypothetical protein AURANDRAFT_69068 [Aureococcus anophagefferens]|eukprot:XP_009043064.1 hypothetical protein AURANDRAFT_69068 [Aureococcus anophagefferens]
MFWIFYHNFVVEPFAILILKLFVPASLHGKISFFEDPAPLAVPHRTPLAVAPSALVAPGAANAFKRVGVAVPLRLRAAAHATPLSKDQRAASRLVRKKLPQTPGARTLADVERSMLDAAEAACDAFVEEHDVARDARADDDFRAIEGVEEAWGGARLVADNTRWRRPFYHAAVVTFGTTMVFMWPSVRAVAVKEMIAIAAMFVLLGVRDPALAKFMRPLDEANAAAPGLILHIISWVTMVGVACVVALVVKSSSSRARRLRENAKALHSSHGKQRERDGDSSESSDDDGHKIKGRVKRKSKPAVAAEPARTKTVDAVPPFGDGVDSPRTPPARARASPRRPSRVAPLALDDLKAEVVPPESLARTSPLRVNSSYFSRAEETYAVAATANRAADPSRPLPSVFRARAARLIRTMSMKVARVAPVASPLPASRSLGAPARVRLRRASAEAVEAIAVEVQETLHSYASRGDLHSRALDEPGKRRYHLIRAGSARFDVKRECPRVHAAVAQLVGGDARLAAPLRGFRACVARTTGGEETKEEDHRDWHVDGWHEPHSRRSGAVGLVVFWLLTDAPPGAGGTEFALGSHRAVARLLEKGDLPARALHGFDAVGDERELVPALLRRAETRSLVGAAGDVALASPLLLHRGGANALPGHARILAISCCPVDELRPGGRAPVEASLAPRRARCAVS